MYKILFKEREKKCSSKHKYKSLTQKYNNAICNSVIQKVIPLETFSLAHETCQSKIARRFFFVICFIKNEISSTTFISKKNLKTKMRRDKT